MSVVTPYVIFSGPLRMHSELGGVALPPVTVQLVSLTSSTTLRSLTSTPLPQTGSLDFPCGLIDRPGSFVVRILNETSNRVLVESNEIAARWPKVTLGLPREFETLAGAVSLSFEIETALSCGALSHDVVYSMELRRYDTRDVIVYDLIRNFTQPDLSTFSNNDNIEMPCEIFDDVGFYQLWLHSSAAPAQPLAISNFMDVTWSTEYAVSTTSAEKSIFPCTDTFRVLYSQPHCAGSSDKIQLYEQIQQYDSHVPGLTSLRYVTDATASVRDYQVLFDCELFDPDAYGYCFRYTSYTRAGRSTQQNEICVPTKDIPGQSAAAAVHACSTRWFPTCSTSSSRYSISLT